MLCHDVIIIFKLWKSSLITEKSSFINKRKMKIFFWKKSSFIQPCREYLRVWEKLSTKTVKYHDSKQTHAGNLVYAINTDPSP